jgi:two-component system cell cycle sensor histidine kinase/response regulator CckA
VALNGNAQPKEADESLKARVERYRNLLAAVRAYSYSVTIENGQPVGTEHGSGCVPVTGYAPEDYAANPMLWFSMVHPADRELVLAHAARAQAGQPAPPIEHRITRRDGQERWVRSTIVPHRDAARRVDRYDGLVEDITDRKQAELVLRQSDSLRAVGTMAGGVAHTFSLLTNAIAASAASLADNLTSDTRAHAEAHSILEAARHAGHLTQRLMSLARICDTGPETELRTVAVTPVIRDTIELVEASLEGKHVRIVFGEPAGPLFVRGNATQLLDVLMNLLVNAAEAMPSGGAITVDTAALELRPRPPLFLNEGKRSAYIVVRVRDAGAGIPRDLRERIFDPFFTTRRERGALGLGLTVVRSIVQGWGGGVAVSGRQGAGACFRLFLPAVSAPGTAGGGPARPAVLLVDDDAECLARLGLRFEKAGYHVFEAGSAEAGRSVFQEHKEQIAATVVDLIMSGAGGGLLVEEILKADPEAKVVVMSGFSRDYVRSRVPSGAWSFVQKPFDDERLVATVGELVGGQGRGCAG